MIKRRTNVEIIALGFAIVILVGTFLLLLPVSSDRTDFLDALFTATSATCVTGLVVYDTATHWTLFGQIVILLLIQIGGLGFITIGVFLATYLKKKISLRQRGLIEESVNSLKLAGGVKLVKHIIKGTFLFEGIGAIILIVGGAVLFYLFECQNSLSSLSQEEMILASFFQSVTCRTAGFNTVDVSHLKPSTSLLMMFLMFVGGSPGSTAGGIKTTTFAVLTIFVYATMTNKSEANAFNRRFDSKTIKKACSVFLINLIFIFISAIALFDMQPQLPMQDVFFEIFSALGTVGISTGITRQLTMLSKIVIVLLMYCGRVGSLTLALSLSRKKKISNCKNPVEKIAIG